jgi:mono/diheme cytochrome c family protein
MKTLSWLMLTAALAAACGGGSAPQDHSPADPPVSLAVGLDRFLLFPNPQQQEDGSLQTDTVAYAKAYYAAVDPLGLRKTLAGWRAANLFGSGGEEITVVFGDTRDLGYGRRLTGRRNADGSMAFVVENYLVNPGGEYADSPLSVEAAVAQDTRWRVGINAIEFSKAPDGVEPFAKFFNFNAQTGAREEMVDLDGRGAKAMPGVCVNCHGGRADALAPGNLFSLLKNTASKSRADTRGQLHAFEVDSFRFSARAGFTRSEQEAALKRLNQFVVCSYPWVQGQPHVVPDTLCERPKAEEGGWGGGTAALVMNAYGGDGMPGSAYHDSYVPVGWASQGQGTLYREVVAKSCRACHLLRGMQAQGSDKDQSQSDIDFDSFAKFEGYAERIKAHVVDRGNMPLAKIVYDRYWASDAPRLMAQFLEGQGLTVRDGSGALLRPGRPVADAGPDRLVKTGVVVKLSARDSLNAESYEWSVAAGSDAVALVDAGTAEASFTPPPGGGTYRFSLVVRKGGEASAPASLTVVAQDGLTPAHDAVRFADVQGKLGACVSCHQNSNANTPFSVVAAEFDDGEDALYAALRSRINLTEIASSPLLSKPAGEHHGGMARPGFAAASAPGSDTRADYDLILNWALGGAKR